MSEIVDAKRFRDGFLYAKLFDPFQKEKREIISNLIEKGSSVIDIGCGTGALAFELVKRCERVVGIDLSSKMIKYAKHKKEILNISNVEFVFADASKLSEFISHKFDYATISLVLHEMSSTNRIGLINELKAITGCLIILDYNAPQPKKVMGIAYSLAESRQGIKKFGYYKSFISQKGINGLLKKSGWKIEKEQIDKTKLFKIVKANTGI